MEKALVKLIENEARRDGLQGNLNIISRVGIANTYDRRSRVIKLQPYSPKFRWRMAQVLAHEIKHQIDLEKYSWWMVGLLYWPPIIGVSLIMGFAFGLWWGLFAGFIIYLFHPFEISANWYALQNWRKYYSVLKNPSK